MCGIMMLTFSQTFFLLFCAISAMAIFHPRPSPVEHGRTLIIGVSSRKGTSCVST